MVSASFLCNLLLGVESVFLVSSQPGARLHFDVKEVHGVQASYLSGGGDLRARLQLPGRRAKASPFGLRSGNPSEALSSLHLAVSPHRKASFIMGLFPSLF